MSWQGVGTALLGVFLGVAGQLAMKGCALLWKRRKMRRAIYRDLLRMYTFTSIVLKSPRIIWCGDHWGVDNGCEFVRTFYDFRGQEYYQKDLDTFSGLDEHAWLHSLYASYRAVLSNPNQFETLAASACAGTGEFFLYHKTAKKWLMSSAQSPEGYLDEMRLNHEQRKRSILEKLDEHMQLNN